MEIPNRLRSDTDDRRWARQDSNLEPVGYEPTALPLSYKPVHVSGRPDSNRRISAWKADALPLGDARNRSGCADSNRGPPRPKRGALPTAPHPAITYEYNSAPKERQERCYGDGVPAAVVCVQASSAADSSCSLRASTSIPSTAANCSAARQESCSCSSASP